MKLTVYTRSSPPCPYCLQAKNLLKLKRIEFDEIDIAKEPDAKQKLVDMGLRTVPQIFLGDSLFVEGGFNGLSNLSDTEINNRLRNFELGSL